MKIKYGHTNIISNDWKKLVSFYANVFGCIPVPPERNQSGEWLDKGTGVKNAYLSGMHLLLPGYGTGGPTLEIYQYSEIVPSKKTVPNRQGFGHIAFQVDDINKMLTHAIENGAQKVGNISEHFVDGVGQLTFIYIADPEGNIIELQNWNTSVRNASEK